jgi:phenylalanyl-tRNA synthetase alpha chain
MHDTFFIKNPQFCKTIPEEYMKKVKEIHEVGGFGSKGYNYDWDE